jgi:TolB-like protein
MNEPDKNSNFLTELTRRRVLRSAAAYIVVAWVVIQVGSIVFPEFDAPAWSMRALIIVFVVGFPPTILLAWTVDFTSQGFIRTPESGYLRTHGQWPRLATLCIATAMSVGVLWLVWDDYILQTGQGPVRTTIKTQPVIAVNSPRQRVGSPENAWLGDGIANLIRGELTESQHAIVISQSRWDALTTEVTGTEALSTMAREIGVDYLIDGEYIETPDGIVLTLHIEDLESRTEIHSTTTNMPDAAAAIASVPEHGMRIKQALQIPHTENVGTFEADFATENVAAYEAYIAGLSYYEKLNLQLAESAFKAALASAPDYHVARLRLAQLYEETGRSALADKLAAAHPAEH